MAMAMCAALYAVGSYVTAYIPSPWGAGQFRPAVIIPAFFAVIFGPLPAGIGAALGTLIADSVKHGYLYPGSYLAAVPGNFIGFYLFGYITQKKFTWGRFIFASNVTLTLANAIVAALYVLVFKILYLGQASYVNLSPDALLFFIIGLTIWWFVTMLPFVLLVTPVLIKAAAAAFPAIVSNDVKTISLREEMPRKHFSLAMLIPGIIMLLIGLTVSYTILGERMMTFFGDITMTLVQYMFYISGAVLTILGLITWRTPSKEKE
jgi:MFS family permease